MNTEEPLPPGIPARQAQGRVHVYSPTRPTPRSSHVAGWEQAHLHLLVCVLSSSTLPITSHLLLFYLNPGTGCGTWRGQHSLSRAAGMFVHDIQSEALTFGNDRCDVGSDPPSCGCTVTTKLTTRPPAATRGYGCTTWSSVIMPSPAWKKMWQCIAQRPRAPPAVTKSLLGRSSRRTLYTRLCPGGMSTTSTNSL